MKIITSSSKEQPCERLQCPLCGCQFEITIGDLHNTEYTEKGKTGFVTCPCCKVELKIYESKCINPTFKLYFSVKEIGPKHIL